MSNQISKVILLKAVILYIYREKNKTSVAKLKSINNLTSNKIKAGQKMG